MLTVLFRSYREQPAPQLRLRMAAFAALGAFGVAALVLYWLLHIYWYDAVYQFGVLLFIILLTMGMGTTITGLIIRFRPATAGGAAAIVLAPVSLIVSGYWMPTLFAVGFVVMMIIPGHILNYKSNHTNG